MTARTSARHGPDEDGRSDEERHDTPVSGEGCDLVSLLATLPEHVADWLIETIEAVAVDPAGPASVGTSRLTGPTTVVAGGPDPVDDPALARAVAGDLIRAARGIQAWAESAEIEGVRRLLAAVEADHNLDLGQHDPPSRRTTRCGLARTAVATELQVLTGLPLTQCRDRVALASAPESRAGYLRARIASGTTSIYRATTVLKETEHLDPFTADEIARRALRPIDGKATKSSDPQAGGHRSFPRYAPAPAADQSPPGGVGSDGAQSVPRSPGAGPPAEVPADGATRSRSSGAAREAGAAGTATDADVAGQCLAGDGRAGDVAPPAIDEPGLAATSGLGSGTGPLGQFPGAEPDGQPVATEPDGQPVATEPDGQPVATEPVATEPDGQHPATEPSGQLPGMASDSLLAGTGPLLHCGPQPDSHEIARVPDGFASETAALIELGNVSQQTFRRRLARDIGSAASPEVDAERVRARARAGRELHAEPADHGMARLDLSAEADRVFAAHERIDRLARKARAEGDPRNLAQLRSDVATDLLVHGTVPDDQLLGDAPPGRVHVVVCLSTLLGLDQLPAEIPGSGLLTAAQARRVALRAGSTWRRIVTDPTTGAAIDSSRTYRPTQAMREHVLARDRTCRAPGCEIVGTGVDLDHVREWCRDARRPADGATHPDNLVLLHRGHHNPKTRRWWKVQSGASGTLRWKTRTGREITTRPGSYRDLTERAAGEDVSFLEARGARRLEELGNPRPLTPEEAALHDHLAEGRRPR